MILKKWLQDKPTPLEPAPDKIGVLFVCMANFCRSPMAKGVFQQLIEAYDLADLLFVDAAGTHSHFAGNPPDPRAQTCCRQRGIRIDHYRARQIQDTDFTRFDYLIAMDRSNYESLRRLAPAGQTGKIRLLLELAPHLGKQEVPDPYYGPPSEFEEVLDLVEEAAQGLLQEIYQRRLYPNAQSEYSIRSN